MNDQLIFILLAVEIPLVLWWITRHNSEPQEDAAGFRIVIDRRENVPEVFRKIRSLDCDVTAIRYHEPLEILVQADFPHRTFSPSDFVAAMSEVSSVNSVFIYDWQSR